MNVVFLALFACNSSDSPPEEVSFDPAVSVVEPGVTSDFTPSGPTFSASTTAEDWSVAFELVGFGRNGDSVASAMPIADGERTVYDHGDVVEWYQTLPAGVEQGFDINSAPTGTGPIELVLAVQTDLFPLFQDDSLSFLGEKGRSLLTYSGLHTVDADGATVPSWMEWGCDASSCELTLMVDDEGARYPITVDPLAFTNETVLSIGSIRGVTTNVPTKETLFGRSVDVHDGVAVIGAPSQDVPSNNAGVAHVYRWNGTVWASEAALSLGLAQGDRCGQSVSVGVDRIAVGCFLANVGPNTDAGAVNIYHYNGVAWTLEQTLTATAPVVRERMGASVDLNVGADRMIAGAPGRNTAGAQKLAGAAYIFERVGTTWTQMARVQDNSVNASKLRNLFGGSVGINDDRAIVGARFRDTVDTNVNFNDGAAFIYERTVGGVWNEVQMVNTATTRDQLGSGVTIEGDVAAIGVPNFGRGRVRIWERAGGGTWSETDILRAEDDRPTDRVGFDVDLKGGRLAVGARLDDIAGETNFGSILIFDRIGAFFVEQVEIYSGDVGLPSELALGSSVGVSGDDVIGGTVPDSGLETAHLFQITNCEAVPTQVGCDVDLIITEVHPSPFHGTSAEFIEVHNAGTSSVHLKGAQVSTAATTFTIDNSMVVHGGGHKLIIQSRDPATNGGITGVPGVAEGLLLDLNPTGDTVRLLGVDPMTTELAAVTYSGFSATGTSLQLDFSGGVYADPTISYDAPTTGGSWCETFEPYIDGDGTTDFTTAQRVNHACLRNMDISFTYIGTPAVMGSTPFTLDGPRFTTGNIGEGEALITGAAGGQTLTMTYDGTGVIYTSDPRPFGDTCFAGGMISNLPAGYTGGSFTATCP